MTNWHRLFGLMLTDFFLDSPFVVELEKDLSKRRAELDVVILRRREGRFVGRLPDGFDKLGIHNLLTFKSHHEALDDWTLKELTGHYVNYRKQLSESGESWLPEDQFRLYAVCSRFPHNLGNEVPLEPLQPGVFQCRRGTDTIRVIVVAQLPHAEQNAMLHLFSGSVDDIHYGARYYRKHAAETSTILNELFEDYREEGLDMPYTMEQFKKDFLKKHVNELPPEERLKGLSPEELLAGLSPNVLKGMLKKLNVEPKATPRKPRRRK
jgi:hypothetical protein